MTTSPEDALKQKLIEENEEYRKLHEEHVQFESELERFTQKKFLSPEEDMEFKRIKKLKLQGKDRMAQILSESAG